MPATAARWGRAPASRRAAINTSAGVRTLTTTAWARAALDDHHGGGRGPTRHQMCGIRVHRTGLPITPYTTSVDADLAGDLPPVGQSRVSSSRQSGPSASPAEIPQVRVPTAIPTCIPRTKRHYAVHLLCVLKVRKSPLTSVYARELGCWSLFQVSALGVIELLKSVYARELGCWSLFQVSALGVIGLLKRHPRGAGVKRRCQIEESFPCAARRLPRRRGCGF